MIARLEGSASCLSVDGGRCVRDPFDERRPRDLRGRRGCGALRGSPLPGTLVVRRCGRVSRFVVVGGLHGVTDGIDLLGWIPIIGLAWLGSFSVSRPSSAGAIRSRRL